MKSVREFDLGCYIGLNFAQSSFFVIRVDKFFILSTSEAEHAMIYKSQLTLVTIEQ